MILGSSTDTPKNEMRDRGQLIGLNSVLQKEPGIRHLYISHNELCLPFLRPPPPPFSSPPAKLKSGSL